MYESASGYALFEVVQHDDIASLTDEVQASINDLQRFGRTIKLKGFQPFTTAENALENMNAVSEHVMTDDLKVIVWLSYLLSCASILSDIINPFEPFNFQNFLEMNLPKVKKSAKFNLGVVRFESFACRNEPHIMCGFFYTQLAARLPLIIVLLLRFLLSPAHSSA